MQFYRKGKPFKKNVVVVCVVNCTKLSLAKLMDSFTQFRFFIPCIEHRKMLKRGATDNLLDRIQ